MTAIRLREHNQQDTAQESGRYDIATLSERSPHPPANRLERFTSPLLKGLAIDYDPDVFTVTAKRAHVAHPGIPKRSPRRGTLVLRGEVNGTKVAVMCAHRINDHHGEAGRAFPKLADRLWRRHAAMDARIATSLIKRGYKVLYGGDINDHDAALLPLLRARATQGRYDAIACSPGVTLIDCQPGPKGGSDHASFTATFEI